MNLQALAIAALVVSVLSFSAGWRVQGWRWAAADAKAVEVARAREAELRAAVDEASAAHEADRGRIRTEFRTIVQEVERVVEKPVYRDRVCLDDDGLRILGAAVRGGAGGAGEPAGALSGPVGAGERPVR